MLKYPNDRVNGYVQLSDGDGNLFVPDMHHTDDEACDAIKFCRAFLILSHRVDVARLEEI